MPAIPKRGYRTVAPVRAVSVTPPTNADLLAALHALIPPFPAYQGDAPAVFAWDAHSDRERAHHDLLRLRDGGINVWFPEPAIRCFEMATAQRPANGEIRLGLGFARGMAGNLNGEREGNPG